MNERLSRRALFGLAAAPLALSAAPSVQRLSVHTVSEADGWKQKIALEPNRVIVAHHGPTTNGRVYPSDVWADAVQRKSIPICVDCEKLSVGWAKDVRIDVISADAYVVSCVPVLGERYASHVRDLTHAGQFVFLTPSGRGCFTGSLVNKYELLQFDLNHESAFKCATSISYYQKGL